MISVKQIICLACLAAFAAAKGAFQVTDISIGSGEKTDNINGEYSIPENWHYSDKHALTWGQNGQTVFSNLITLSSETAVYNCTNTDSYSCEDVTGWMYDWNKLWGKGRCGYYHDHHKVREYMCVSLYDACLL